MNNSIKQLFKYYIADVTYINVCDNWVQLLSFISVLKLKLNGNPPKTPSLRAHQWTRATYIQTISWYVAWFPLSINVEMSVIEAIKSDEPANGRIDCNERERNVENELMRKIKSV